jgi:hypothetical protein
MAQGNVSIIAITNSQISQEHVKTWTRDVAEKWRSHERFRFVHVSFWTRFQVLSFNCRNAGKPTAKPAADIARFLVHVQTTGGCAEIFPPGAYRSCSTDRRLATHLNRSLTSSPTITSIMSVTRSDWRTSLSVMFTWWIGLVGFDGQVVVDHGTEMQVRRYHRSRQLQRRRVRRSRRLRSNAQRRSQRVEFPVRSLRVWCRGLGR